MGFDDDFLTLHRRCNSDAFESDTQKRTFLGSTPFSFLPETGAHRAYSSQCTFCRIFFDDWSCCFSNRNFTLARKYNLGFGDLDCHFYTFGDFGCLPLFLSSFGYDILTRFVPIVKEGGV